MVTDYMHCVLLGVAKTLLNTWLDYKHRSKEFHIGRQVWYDIPKSVLVIWVHPLKYVRKLFTNKANIFVPICRLCLHKYFIVNNYYVVLS